ncbi:MAG TPA: YetF domain-containing protein [Reyranellaceae bacterium]|nr:YetF domain-containing protein [Reyranellaceae bacterium]
MDKFWAIDWHGMFVPQGSLLELVLRGTIMYLVIFVLLRVVLKRQVGGIGTSDILVVVLLAEVAGNGFGKDYKSVVEGTVLIGTVLFWSYAVDWLQHRFPAFERLVREEPLKLISNGRMLRKNMADEMVSVEELMAQLREKGLDKVSDVKVAFMEADGRVSVVPKRR